MLASGSAHAKLEARTALRYGQTDERVLMSIQGQAAFIMIMVVSKPFSLIINAVTSSHRAAGFCVADGPVVQTSVLTTRSSRGRSGAKKERAMCISFR